MDDEFQFVTDQPRLDEFCRECRACGRFVFDTEFIRDDTYDAILCLLQVATAGGIRIIDPTEGLDLRPFWELVCDPKITTIVHAGKEDFEVCLRQSGSPPRNVFDVQIAAGFAGHGYPLSLSRLVSAILHRRIAKGQTLTDWARRPLTDDQLRYAVEDVAYLWEIHDRLSDALRKSNRCEWATEEFRRFEDPEFYKPPPQDRLFKLKGARRLDGRGLAVLEKLIAWRDRWAEQRNRPVRALIRDDVLVDIAKRRPTKPAQLEVLRGFPQARNPKIVREVLDTIQTGLAVPNEDRPTPHQPREDTPMTKATLDVLSAYARAVCHEENVDHDLVGSTRRLRELMDFLSKRQAEQPQLLSGWRETFIGKRLVDLLEGKTELHLSGWPAEPRLNVMTHSNGQPRG